MNKKKRTSEDIEAADHFRRRLASKLLGMLQQDRERYIMPEFKQYVIDHLLLILAIKYCKKMTDKEGNLTIDVNDDLAVSAAASEILFKNFEPWIK